MYKYILFLIIVKKNIQKIIYKRVFKEKCGFDFVDDKLKDVVNLVTR